MSIWTPNGYFGDHGIMPKKLSWKHDTPCDFHSPDIGTSVDLCGRCGWKRHEHPPHPEDETLDPKVDF